MLPNDSVRFVAYRPEHHAYGTGPALAAVERHVTELSAIALRVLRAGAAPHQRAAIALAATMTTRAVCEPDLEAAASRVAGALHRTPAGGPLDADRSIVEAAYARDRAALLRQARACWAGDVGPAGAVLDDWSRSVRSLHAVLTSLWAAADGPSDPGSPMGPLAAVTGADRRAVTLVLLRCAHLFNNRLGLGLDVETRLGLLVARTLADLHHRTPPRPGPAAPPEMES
ncbi:lantibiotic dehydratase C-terminal domain-containing protein [Dactylosporangium sp. NBC_01737]|uniref:lantibiotic dehydratase C-terminal domain-containing protein n=1 Tax=Dactylosporangium sp. NBC_01737 TaxID=2975959 RepID=UPI003FA3C39A